MNKIENRKSLCGTTCFKSQLIDNLDVVDEKKKIIELKFSSFGNKDSDDDILVKGAFLKSIQERGPQSVTNRKIGFLWQHMVTEPIGRPIEIYEKEDGAYAAVQFSNLEAVPRAKQAYYQLRDGDINQFSFGFSYIWDKMEYDEERDAFIIREVKLFEISVVTFGANENTEFIGELKGDDALRNYLKMLSINEQSRFNELKQYINNMEAEPVRPLTSHGLFDSIGSKI